MTNPGSVLTPDNLALLDAVATEGSFAAAGRRLDLVPSALSYRVRQIEDALDVLLFDRSSRQARPTAAGAELLREGRRLLADSEAVARRVQRVATGWESRLTIAVDGAVAYAPLLDLVADFYALGAPTRLRLRDETLLGTVQALTSGEADLAVGSALDETALAFTGASIRSVPLGEMRFVYAVAPGHPLAEAAEPLSPAVLLAHRAVAAADSARSGATMTVNLGTDQDVFTVPSLQIKLAAQLRGLGGGFLPEPMARPWLATGALVARRTALCPPATYLHIAWRESPSAQPGRALQWWLTQLRRPATRRALMEHDESNASQVDTRTARNTRKRRG